MKITLEVKNVKTLHFDAIALNKKEKCDQIDLNISYQSETLILCSTIYFLGISVQLSQKLATENSSIGKKISRFTIFESRILK